MMKHKNKKRKSKKKPKMKMSLGGQIYAPGIIPNYTSDELYQNQLMFQKIQSDVNADPFLNALQMGFAALPMLWDKFGGNNGMATGGVVKEVEVEGGEVAETPMGKLMKFMGANHEQGGIDAQLPIGTKVYSKRLKVNQKTMAERKMMREKKMSRMRNKLRNNPHDKVLKNTAKRIDAVNKKLDAMDMTIQENMRNMMDMMSMMGIESEATKNTDTKEKFQTGGVIEYGDPRYPSFMWGLPMPVQSMDTKKGIDLNITPEPSEIDIDTNQTAKKGKAKSNKKSITETLSSMFEQNQGYMGYGDPFTIAGDIMNTISPLQTLAESRGSDTPNINFYKTYGQSALNKTQSLYDLVNRSASTMKRNTIDNYMMQKNRSKARSVNTQRALDIMNYMGMNKSLERIEQNKYSQLANITNREAQLSMNIDRMRMTGEQQRDQADRQDKDNYYSMKSQALQQFGRGMQEIGKDLNQLKYNDMMRFLLEAGNKYGMSINNKGQIVSGSPVEKQSAGNLFGQENFGQWQSKLPETYGGYNQANREVSEKAKQEYEFKMQFGSATPDAVNWFVTSKGMSREDLSRAINGDESVLKKYKLTPNEVARIRSFRLSDMDKKELGANMRILNYATPVNYYNPTGSELNNSLPQAWALMFNPLINPYVGTSSANYNNNSKNNYKKKTKK